METLVGTEQFGEACQRVLHRCQDQYAKSYAAMGIEMLVAGNEREVLVHQAHYILGNLSQWRGEEATRVKNMLRAFAGLAVRRG